MIKYLLTFLVLAGLIWLSVPLITEFTTSEGLNNISSEYVQLSAEKLNIPNTVTAIVVTFRGLDTLGEVTVLFLATAGVGFFLKRKDSEKQKKRPGSEILKTGSGILTPMIIVLGVYIFVHGHLTPGGGFQGGVVIASAFLLLILAYENFKFSHLLIHISESISGFTYVLIGLAGLAILGFNHFLDPRWLGLGEWGKLFSAGAVPIIYSLIGIKVGAEMSSLLDSMRDEGGHE
ncbi:MAG: Na(+)/H(+) antiporter subunit B [Candidatus Cloacimonetes bacterium]|nr:Na(+)/H(+) antiporter subunit B [Candidatus Cloacimonadota bacterium]